MKTEDRRRKSEELTTNYFQLVACDLRLAAFVTRPTAQNYFRAMRYNRAAAAGTRSELLS